MLPAGWNTFMSTPNQHTYTVILSPAPSSLIVISVQRWVTFIWQFWLGMDSRVQLLARSFTWHPKSPKVDVYAFGMVLFEIISGRKPYIWEDRATSSTGDSNSSPAGCSESGMITDLFAPILNDADGMTQLPRYIDPALKNDYSLDAVWKMAQLAGRCTHRSPDLRPTMRLAVMELMTLASTTQECEDVDYLS